MSLGAFIEALLLQSGYNAALVAIGAALLGMAAGGSGTFIFLRKRALVSDAAAHATLPGIAIAFIVMVSLGGDGRNLAGLMLGAALSAAVGLLIVDWIGRSTRLPEDAAIGAVMSVFFGFGIVLLTFIQTMSSGRQAGLEGFLLGSTAGMLFDEAVTIAIAGALAAMALFALVRPMTLVAFDAEFAATTGVNVRLVDLATMGLALMVVVIGLKIVGLVLIIALLIIPSVAARFWTERAGLLVLIAAAIGGASGYVGAALSAAAPQMPTGPIIVLVGFSIFIGSLLFAPARGVVASMVRRRRFETRVQIQQGLLTLGRGEEIENAKIARALQHAGYLGGDRSMTVEGATAARATLLDEARWNMARRVLDQGSLGDQYDGLTAIEEVLTRDQIALLDQRIAGANGDQG